MYILGQDDFLIFARDDNGNLVYTVVELDREWLNVPYSDFKYNLKTDTYEYFDIKHGSPEWKANWLHMIKYVENHMDDYWWERAEYPLNMSDEVFQKRSIVKFGWLPKHIIVSPQELRKLTEGN